MESIIYIISMIILCVIIFALKKKYSWIKLVIILLALFITSSMLIQIFKSLKVKNNIDNYSIIKNMNDSLMIDNIKNTQSIDSLKSLIGVSINKIDSLGSIKKVYTSEIIKQKEKTHEKIITIDTFNSNDIDSFFTNYGKGYYQKYFYFVNPDNHN